MKRGERETRFRAEYAARAGLYADFTQTVAALLDRLLTAASLNAHSITSRLKSQDSLLKKVSTKGKYSGLTEVTDLAGVRVITYFSNDVDRVAEIVKSEFDVDLEHSVDKRAALDPDRFGYISLHSVVRLSEGRRALTEYVRFADCRAEIQIRSILQHAWAEIEHDLGYKSEAAIPKEIRRRFSRLAGLLEIADSEFETIKYELERYESAVPGRIEAAPDTVALDQASLNVLITEDPSVRELHDAVRELGLSVEDDDDILLPRLVPALELVGLHNIGDLRTTLRNQLNRLKRFMVAELHVDRENGLVGIWPSLPLLYLAYALAAEQRGPEALLGIAEAARLEWRGNEKQAEHLMRMYLDAGPDKSKSAASATKPRRAK